MLSCALRMSKDGSIALFNFRVADDLLASTVCGAIYERVTVENGLDRLINYDTIKMYLIAHWIAN